jgi:hypothetical protein
MFDKFLKMFGQPVSATEDEAVKKIRKPKISDKDKATARKEPFIRVIETHVDPKNPSNGYFELDWNSFFIDDLKKAGYTGTTEEEIIEKWFKALCQNILSEDEATKERRIV